MDVLLLYFYAMAMCLIRENKSQVILWGIEHLA